MLTALRACGVTVAVSRAESPVLALLRTYGLSEWLGEERLFTTNRAAVAAFTRVTEAL